MTETVNIAKGTFGKIVLALSVVFGAVMFLLFSTPYTGLLVFTVLLLVWAAYYTYMSRKDLSEMCCMMSGMAFGMVGGFFVGTLSALASGDFLTGMVAGALAGIVFGVPMGMIGGPMGRMEGVMAGPMGGIMGGMTGIMIRFFNVQLFMPFFVLVILFTVWEMMNVIHGQTKNISRSFLYIGVILSVLAFSSTFVGNYGIEGTGLVFAKEQNSPALPTAPGSPAQEISIKMEALGYDPNYVVVKKDVPVRLNLEAAQDAGCTRAIIFPDFNIRKTLPRGGKTTVEFTPTKAGTFRFSCSMAMAGGTLVVQ